MGTIYETSCDKCGLIERNTTGDCEHFHNIVIGEPYTFCDSCQTEYNAFATGLRDEYAAKVDSWVKQNIPQKEPA